jgi:predicted transcriptional regulator
VRAAFSHLAIHELGASAASVARALCVSAPTVHAYLLKARRDVLPRTSEERSVLRDLK